MKKFSLVLVSLIVVTCGLLCCAYAEPLVDVANSVISIDSDSIIQKTLSILDKLTIWILPICAGFLVWGAVQYFIMGIRNLYKKKQGLWLMFGSMTFYVVIVALNLILSVMVAGELNIVNTENIKVEEFEDVALELGDTAAQTVYEIMKYVTEWALPFCAILAIFGAVQFFIMGIRNLYKKRQGLLLMFGSAAFFLILVVVTFIVGRLIG